MRMEVGNIHFLHTFVVNTYVHSYMIVASSTMKYDAIRRYTRTFATTTTSLLHIVNADLSPRGLYLQVSKNNQLPARCFVQSPIIANSAPRVRRGIMTDNQSLPQHFGRGGGRGNATRNAGRSGQSRGTGTGTGRTTRNYNNFSHHGRGGRGGRGGRSHHDGHRFASGTGRGKGRLGGSSLDDSIDELGIRTDHSMCIAIQGCCHGELDAIYDRIRRYEDTKSNKVDLLLCCGDFQSLRNTADFHSLAVPQKYRNIGNFHKYYSGEREAPVLTIFIGGNHEAWQPLQELYYGGWVAPKIYYLGAAGVVNVGGVRIGGVSGIYKPHDYTQGRFERPPYDNSTIRSIYHVRNMDIYRMKSLSKGPDIMMSHDWPQGIEQFGNTQELLRKKPFFRQEVERNELGSPCNRELLNQLKPKWWFSAHLHVKFMAAVNHTSQKEKTINSTVAALVPSQIVPLVKQGIQIMNCDVDQHEILRDEFHDNMNTEMPRTTHFHALQSTDNCNGDNLTEQMTRFLSLDKCLPRRQFLSVLHVPSTKPKDVIEYDMEWLTILKKTHDWTVTQHRRVIVPNEVVKITEEDLMVMRSIFTERGVTIPNNFQITVPPHNPSDRLLPQLPIMGNPQCDEFLSLLGMGHILTVPFRIPEIPLGEHDGSLDENEIDLNEEEEKETIDLELCLDTAEIDQVADEIPLVKLESVPSGLEEYIKKKPRLDK